MQNDKFEWDDAKAKTNAALHGVTFEFASQSFSDSLALEFLDDREDYGEERFVRVGMVGGTILSVVYTERAGRTRLISARFATRVEQDEYHRRASE